MGLHLDEINTDGIRVFIEETDNGPTLFIEGIIETRDPGEILRPFFIDLHKAIIIEGLREFHFDVKKLQFMNSSGIKSIVEWVMYVDDLPLDKQYKIIFHYDHSIMWQESSIKTISMLNPERIMIAE